MIAAELFCGGGMARIGLGEVWTVVLANDLDAMKAAAYADNHGAGHLIVGDVADIAPRDLPAEALGLLWMSPPCQDLSLAGLGAGLNGSRSGAIWPALRLIRDLTADGRAPRTVVIENVVGMIRRGMATIMAVLQATGYSVGSAVIDAARFLPQSRPRLFVVASINHAKYLETSEPEPRRHPPALIGASPPGSVWWRLPETPARSSVVADVLEPHATGIDGAPLLAQMAKRHRTLVTRLQADGRRHVGAAYRRTRNGVVFVEPRFDGLTGCLRTPAGGSSRQLLIEVEGPAVRSRLMSRHEEGRLMGLPESSYRLPTRDNHALRLNGDGVAVPAVRHLSEHLLEPLSCA